MGFFESYWTWLNEQLSGYIGDNTARVATALEPAVVTLATVFVMVWGYLQLTGRIEEPLVTGLRRIMVLALVLGVASRLWLYNSLLVDTFYRAPAQLASYIVGATDPVSSIDAIWQQGGAVAGQLWSKGSLMYGDPGFYLAGAAVWLLVGMLCVYAMFLISLSSIACAVLLAIGPLFVMMLLFESTRRFFDAWIGQLVTYALITILTVLVAALLLTIVQSYAAQTAARGSAILTVDALDMVLISGLVFLLMRQIMPIAGGLGGGIAPTSFGVVSRFIGGGRRHAAQGLVQIGAYALAKVGSQEAVSVATSWRDP
jgi:type IV secretion system protein VirB6